LTITRLVLPAKSEKLAIPNPGKREGCPILSNFSFGETPSFSANLSSSPTKKYGN